MELNCLNILPFFSIENEDELLSTIWNSNTDINHISSNASCLNLFNNDDLSLPLNWNPDKCKYITTDELFNNNIYCNKFTITQINTRSIKKNFEPLKAYIGSFRSPPQVITLAETWLKENDHVYYNIPGYNLISLPRPNRIGGGVGIYLSNIFSYTIKSDLMDIMKDVCEYVVIDVSINSNESIIIVSMYRPPNTDLQSFNIKFNNFLDKLTVDRRKKIFIAADTNIDLLKINSHSKTEEFLNTLLSFSFLPTITKPTRITSDTSTLLDNIFTNCFEHLISSDIVFEDISDHLPTIINIDMQNKHPITAESTEDDQRRCFNSSNFKDFYNKLKCANWSDICSKCLIATDPTPIYNEFSTKFYKLYNESFPLKTDTWKSNKRNHHPWMTQSLVRCCRKKSRLLKKFNKFPNVVNRIKYKTYRKTLKQTIVTAESNYYQAQFSKYSADIRMTWKTLNNAINISKERQDNISLVVNNMRITDPTIIVSKFNDHFINIGPKLASNIPACNKQVSDYLSSPPTNSMNLVPTDKSEIIAIIKTLKNSTSLGLDKIPSNIIKFGSEIISSPLADIINCTLRTCIFPNSLKAAKVMPIFKSGDSSQLSNYRPISILNSFSKIFEKIISNRLLNFLNKNQFFYSQQFGFRQNHSTSSALIAFNEYITNALDRSETPISVFIDFSKAFDTLDHKILLTKLNHFGIRGHPLKLVENYLYERTQAVFYKNKISNPQPIICGIPQGSILGPLLFLIYINDIYTSSSVLNFILFADDTTILLANKSLANLLLIINKELVKVNEWCQVNRLSLNINKTNFMIFNKNYLPSNENQIVIENNIIKHVSSTKFLGIEINSSIGWKEHIGIVNLKIARAIGVIRRVRFKLSIKTSMLLYDSLILSQLTYCNIIWASTYKTSLSKTFILQKRALKLCMGKHYCYNTYNNQINTNSNKSIFTQSKKLSIFDINKLQTAKFIYQVINKLSPPSFFSLFSLISSVHSYKTRNEESKKLFLKHAKSNVRKFSISVRGPQIWNELPEPIRIIPSVDSFHVALKKYFNI